MGDTNPNNPTPNPTRLDQTYYRRRTAGVCPDDERPSGIWVYCSRCRRRHRERMARYNALYPRPSHRRK